MLSLRLIFFVIASLALFSELFLSYFPVGMFPVRNYIWAVGVLLLLVSVISKNSAHRIKFGAIERGVVLLMVLGLLASFFWRSELVSSLRETARYLIIPFFIYKIVVSALGQNRPVYEATRLVAIYVVLVAISCLIAIFQSLDFDWAWALRLSMPVSEKDQGGMVINALVGHHRPTGMAFFPISLAYQTVWAFPFAWYISSICDHSVCRKFAYLMALIIMLGCVTSGTRSAMLAILAQYILLKILMNPDPARLLWALAKALAIALLLFICFFMLANARWSLQDSSFHGKPWLSYLGVLFIVDNPLGQGFDWAIFQSFKSVMLPDMKGLPPELKKEVLAFSPHNQFINSGVMYGWLGLAWVMWFYWSLIRSLRAASQSTQGQHQKLVMALLVAFVGYILNSLFHNNGLFVGDVLGWYFLAIAMTVLSLDKSEKIMKHTCV